CLAVALGPGWVDRQVRPSELLGQPAAVELAGKSHEAFTLEVANARLELRALRTAAGEREVRQRREAVLPEHGEGLEKHRNALLHAEAPRIDDPGRVGEPAIRRYRRCRELAPAERRGEEPAHA